jgi:hypothetical protein
VCKVRKNGNVFYTFGNTTVCLIMQEGVPIARGLAIHSSMDLFDPAEGRRKAIARAKEALNRKENCAPIMLTAPRGNAYDWFDSSVAKDAFGEWKGYYMPDLTGTEKMLLENNGRKIVGGYPIASTVVRNCTSTDIGQIGAWTGNDLLNAIGKLANRYEDRPRLK